MAAKTTSKTVTTLKHDEVTRKNIPTAEYQSVLQHEEQSPVRVTYQRCNRDRNLRSGWHQSGPLPSSRRTRIEGERILVTSVLRKGKSG